MSDLSEQQEKFCRNIVEGMSQAEAYLKAGYKCKPEDARCHASALITKHNVAARIAQLREKATEGTEITLQWLLEQTQGIMKDAWENGSYSAAVAAVKELGVLTGERVEKRQNENVNRDASDLTDAELAAYLKGDGGERAAGPASLAEKPDSIH